MITSVEPRTAATIVIVRDTPHGLEVLLMRRAEKGDHNSGAWVFPGGLVERTDQRCHAACCGLDDAAASAIIGVQRNGLDHYVAAIRECFEEAGLLFAVDAQDQLVNLQTEFGTHLSALRGALHDGRYEFDDLCRNFGLRLATDRLFYFAHWLTPIGRVKRFDTRFFLAVLPEGQTSKPDAIETLDQVWLRPAAALSTDNSRRLMVPTRSIINTISQFSDTHSLLAWARSPHEVKKVLPRLSVASTGPRPVLPHEPAWAEIGRLDPQGHGTVWCEIRSGVPVRLSPRVLRVSADLGGNTYLVGGGERNEWSVIDPGPLDESHIEALIAAAPGRICWIFHTHAETSPATALLQARTGARLVNRPADMDEAIVLSSDTTLRVLRHPDLDSPRLCYLLMEEKTLFTGSMAVDVAWVHPHLREKFEWLAPGRGFLIAVL
jgi:8-oxo-dGTP pyrophosphatase MutT (NUDIX family)